MQEDKRSTAKISTVSHLLSDGRLVELVCPSDNQQTIFAVHDGKQCKLTEQLQLDSGDLLVPVPATNNLIRHRVVLLPEKPEAYGSPAKLIEAIQAYIYRYVDLSDQFRAIASYYVLLSWVYDAFNELPYLRLRGDFGSGKTRALKVIGSICYKPFFASGATTVSPIFHILDTFRGTLILDEADFRFSDEKSDLVKIFNNGNTKGFPVLRTTMTAKKEFDPRAFHVFGPKIIAMRRSFEDHALESRFLTEEMGQRSLRKDIPINLPQVQEEEARILRNKLLMYRFQSLRKIQVNDDLIDLSLSPRLNQILAPILSLIEDKKLCDELRNSVRSFEQKLFAERAVSSEGGVLEVLAELLADISQTNIPIAEITTAFITRFGADHERTITNRFIGGILRTRLHLTTYKSHGVYVVPVSEKDKVTELCLRFGVVQNSSAKSPV